MTPNHTKAHNQLKNEAAHALARLPKTLVLEVEPFRGRDEKGIYRNAGLRQPGGKAKDVLDLLVIHQGQAFFLDAKTGAAKLTEGQQRFCELCLRLGIVAAEFRSAKEAVEIVTKGTE